MKPEVHIALLHHPVVNKQGDIVSTAVTNLDIHDNARTARTYDVASYHIITPLDAQIELVSRILNHWRDGYGARRVPNRVSAINLVRVNRTLDDALEQIVDGRDVTPFTIATCARQRDDTVRFADLRQQMHEYPTQPYVVLFGTGYGMAESILESSGALLEAIGDPQSWNHLSVRSAVAIVLDRLLGER